MPSSRRRFLTVGAGLAAGTGLAGCVGDAGPADGTERTDEPTSTATPTDDEDPEKTPRGSETPTDPPDETARAVGDATVAVSDIVARKAVVYASTMGSGGIVAREGEQYVVASVHSEAELDGSAFSFPNGDRSWTASDLDEAGALNRAVAGHEGGFVGSPVQQTRGYVAFAVDSPLEPSEPRIRLEHGGESAEWTLPEDAVSTLAAEAPRFELDSWEAPDRVTQGDEMDISLSVTNASEVAGRFLAAVYWPTERIEDDDESTILEATVDAGASTTETATIDTGDTASEDGPVELRVEGHVEASAAITVVGAGTDA